MISTSNNLSGANLTSGSNRPDSVGATTSGKTASPGAGLSKSSFGSVTQVDLSDRAKIILDRDQINRAALEKLQTLLGKTGDGISGSAKKKFTSVSDFASNPPASLSMNFLDQIYGGLREKNRQKDGSVSKFDVTVRDISMVPATQKEMDYWYKTDGADFVNGAADGDSTDRQDMVEAIKNKEITFINAKDISDLDYHNTARFQGGDGGGAPGLTRTYNQNSSIFKDSSKGYLPLADGTVISWNKRTSVG